jgi:serine/threonine-protein kinase
MAEILLGRLLGPSGFDRAVVIKRILPHLARQKQFRTMFLDEARIVAGITHPNVVSVQELGRDGDDIFLVFEYLEGESLSTLVRALVAKGVTPEARLCAHVVAEACAGLHAAHEIADPDQGPRNLVHRDVSPQNVFLTYDGQVKVIDFGIATATDRITRTETGQLKGKFEYMSPEQCTGKSLDRRSDIFSLGAVLYEATTGRRLFKRPSPAATVHAVAHEPVTPPSRVVEGYPASLEAICLKALARNREDRYATAADMRRDLLVAMRSLPAASGASEDPSEALAKLMADAFAQRIAEKREMLRRVRSGSNVTHVPSELDDDSRDLPSVAEAEAGPTKLTATGGSAKPGRVGRRARVGQWALIALVSAGLLFFAGVKLQRRPRAADAPAPSLATSASSATAPAAASEAASTAPAAPAASTAQVAVHVETKPPGAHVLIGGAELGVTPTDVRLPQGTTPLSMQLRRSGYQTLVQRLVPDSDQRLLLSLEPLRSASPSPRPAAPPPSAPPAGTGFRRFD